jgi:hypothetical protein
VVREVAESIKMSYIMVDVEADGPIPGDYSMVAVGAIVVEPTLTKTFYAELRPVSDKWVPESLAVCGFSREQTLLFSEPQGVMESFAAWIVAEAGRRPLFIADNNGFDWQFVNWYFHHFCGHNPFGYSSLHLGSLYKGLTRDMFVNFKHLRKTKHTHNALDDARGNAEALLQLKEDFDLKISWK